MSTSEIEASPQAAADSLEAPPRRPRGGLPGGLVKLARPKQWVKNVLVFAAPLAAGRIDEWDVLRQCIYVFAIFCLAAASIYYVNDAADVESDRRHPKKRNRPIASGAVPVKLAWALGPVLAVGSVVLAVVLCNRNTALVVGLYIVLNLFYCFAFKHVLVLDLMMVASGFLFRAMIGGLAAELPLSRWFLLTAGFGSLFMVAGKRYSEMVLMGEEAAKTRASLANYSITYLRFVWQMAVAVTVLTYSLWAFEIPQGDATLAWQQLSLVPFGFVLLRYALYVDAGTAGAPEDVVLKDKVIVGLGLAWLIMFVLGVFHV
ncbi:decaprenyl-phosphate phosphoribosyltransferase [Yinghuangia sp. ASG 101]|uniref:decaprenyl-phosphate phosphoribosyltransferase n=1 Tax=Yinghuangia sp. ASG 101 TaxID=2896848 RepID=UPI001E3B302F|nr:decaprenyl-phosphate phosphoribosyltransferase [Yinghuangia sp. ASG 101]UGQ10121.1 decaprenyl-phosphate phosphoribosyltransferase [Yinghuangia sp. ASG 101]